MEIREHQSLRQHNTLGFEVAARYFACAESTADVSLALEFSRQHQLPLLILGGGSNLVLTDDHSGLVIKPHILGKDVVLAGKDSVRVRVGAGENWHELVNWGLNQSYFGLENLSLIPGSVGAAPIQNIGAYGVELADVFFELEAVEIATGATRRFSRADCCFGYRESVFKDELLDQYIITHVTLELALQPAVNTSYGALAAELENVPADQLSPKMISEAVCRVRSAKLPDPAELGNVGSFFKNPVIDHMRFQELQQEFPEIIGYPDGPAATKLAAGWLIEACGWKGFRERDVGVYPHQALVLVNYGEGCVADFMALAESIRASVRDRFAIDLEIEPRIYPAPEVQAPV